MPTNPSNLFSVERSDEAGIMTIALVPNFGVQDWPELEAFYRTQIQAGVCDWRLDLRPLNALNSSMIGLMVGLNTILSTRRGSLRLRVLPGSDIERTLLLCRLDVIMTIEGSRAEQPQGGPHA